MTALAALASARVALATYDEVTGDLRIDFDNGVSLQVLVTSSGYESWTLSQCGGAFLVATGGGRVVPFDS